MGDRAEYELTVIIPSDAHVLVQRGGEFPVLVGDSDRIPGEHSVVAFGRRVLGHYLTPNHVTPNGKGGRAMTTKPVSNAELTHTAKDEYWWVPIKALDGRELEA